MTLVHLTAALVDQTPAVDPYIGGADGWLYTFESLGIPDGPLAPQITFPDSTHLVGPETTTVAYQCGYTFSGAAYSRPVGVGPPVESGSTLHTPHVYASAGIGWVDASAADYYDGTQTIGLLHSGSAFAFLSPDGPTLWWFPFDLSGRDLTLHAYYYTAGTQTPPCQLYPRDDDLGVGTAAIWPPPSSGRPGGYY